MNKFKIQIQNMNKKDVLYTETSTEAFNEYFRAKTLGYKASVYNQDGILIAGIWR